MKPKKQLVFPAYLEALEELVEATEFLKNAKKRCETTGNYAPMHAASLAMTKALIGYRLLADRL